MSDTFLLLVEDEPIIAMSIQDSLEDAGHPVHVVHSGVEAMLAIEAGSPKIHALLTDIRCGCGADGWEISRLARAKAPALPVVYISGDSAGDHAARGVPNSVMIPKPFARAAIVHAVDALLNA